MKMKTIAKPFQRELEIKKSQFVCRIFPISDSKDAKEIIHNVSKKYNDATHNCSAYVTIDNEGYDDDGEPSGTAGRPMLNILKKNNLKNIVAIVTRYFGGIKLGAGGLVRAYSKSVLEAIEIAEIIEMELYQIYEIIFDYILTKHIDKQLRNQKIHILNKRFEDKVCYEIAIKKEEEVEIFHEKFKSQININFLKKEYLISTKLHNDKEIKKLQY